MGDNHYPSGSGNFTRKRLINTAGCCFMCLKILNFKSDAEESEMQTPNTKSTVSLDCLHRCLQINTKDLLQNSSAVASASSASYEDIPTSGNDKEYEVELCGLCKDLIERFSEAFSTLERIQIEVNGYLGRIHKQIAGASRNPEVVQSYSWRMASHAEAFRQFGFVESLRQEIKEKSSKANDGLQHSRMANSISQEIRPSQLNRTEAAEQLMEENMAMDESFEPSSFTVDNSNVNVKIEPPEAEEEYLEDNEFISSPPPTSASSPFPPTIVQSVLKEEVQSQSPSQTIYETTLLLPPPPASIEVAFPPDPLLNQQQPGPSTSSAAAPVPATRGSMYVYNPETSKYTCNACNENFPTRQKAWKHYQRSHKNTKNGNRNSNQTNKKGFMYKFHPETKRYVCNFCSKEFQHRGSAFAHFNKAHANFKCDICKVAVFQNLDEFNQHKTLCEIELRSNIERLEECSNDNASTGTGNDPTQPHVCSACGKRFAANFSLVQHYRLVHLDERKYKCELCDKSFKMLCHLKDHKNSVHFGIKFVCQYCSKRVQNETKLKRHEEQCGEKNEVAYV